MSKHIQAGRRVCDAGMILAVHETETENTETTHMHYMLIMNETAADLARRDDPEQAGTYWGAWGAYVKEVEAAGIFVSGAGLQPPHTATTVRIRDGRRQVHDGPYSETKELLGGFFVIDVPTLDVALEWAARSPAAGSASVEVRPVLPPMNP